MRKFFLLLYFVIFIVVSAKPQIVGTNYRHIYTSSSSGPVINLGTVNEDSTQNGNANYYQTNYIETGSDANGYTVTGCSLWIGAGAEGGNIDCVLIPAASSTTYSSNVLCHGTYTETFTAPMTFVSVPMASCGTLPPNTFYWVGINTNDNTVDNGFYSCDAGTPSCTGVAGTPTYNDLYQTATYGVYTGLDTSTLQGAGEGLQIAAYLQVTAN